MGNPVTSVSIEERTLALKEATGDTVSVDKIGDIVGSILKSGSGDNDLTIVMAELNDLLQYIGSAKDELARMQPKSLAARDIPDANLELDAVVAATENAAGVIMDTADELTEIAETVKPKKTSDRLAGLSNALIEASSFQDLTGQRITKVAKTLAHLEERLTTLAGTIGDDYVAPEELVIEKDDDGVAVNDDDLLHGPQMEGEGNSQEEIDALLASFD